jgi:micrococcal nuclease
VKVVDGDTIDVLMNGEKFRVRLIGINTPESVDPRRPVQCFGKEASSKAKEILNGKSVFLEADPTQTDRDKYDRLLRYVFLEDGTNFNKFMVSEGYAYEYTYDVPYKYQKEFKAAQKAAESLKKGLWAEDTCGGKL